MPKIMFTGRSPVSWAFRLGGHEKLHPGGPHLPCGCLEAHPATECFDSLSGLSLRTGGAAFSPRFQPLALGFSL